MWEAIRGLLLNFCHPLSIKRSRGLKDKVGVIRLAIGTATIVERLVEKLYSYPPCSETVVAGFSLDPW